MGGCGEGMLSGRHLGGGEGKPKVHPPFLRSEKRTQRQINGTCLL